MIKLDTNKKLLFDGFENDIFKKEFLLKEKKINIKNIINNRFKKLREIINENNFNTIIKDLNIIKHNELFESYKSSDDSLSIYYLIDDNNLFIFSYGEFQPARYILYLEGIYSLK
ncbi:MAG: hypothetical protein BGO86_13180 [Chryseobacterium sp. 36-9]|nr:MAG: hypothetical protein BGO86_13180 [Chryseobacterium sp. 36-9]